MYIAQFYHPISSSSITTRGIVKGLAEKGHGIDLFVPLACLNECSTKCSFECNKKERIRVLVITLIAKTLLEKKNASAKQG